MRRFLCFCLGLVLGFTLVLPVHLMAGNLNIQTSDGYNIGLNKPYKGFFVDLEGNLTVMMDGIMNDLPKPFQYEPTITISGAGTDNATGIVNGTNGNPVTFNISCSDSSGIPTLTYALPAPLQGEPSPFTSLAPSNPDQGTFTKTYTTVSTNIVIFQASITETPAGGGSPQTFTTRREIKIVIAEPTSTLTVAATNGTVSATLNGQPVALPWTGTSGNSIVLTATPNAGYAFGSWSGDASGTTSPVTVVMNGNKNVTANFTAIAYTLTVNIAGTGTGTVTKTPQKTTYTYGDQVVLTANATSGSFAGWSGDCSGTTNPYTLTMNGNKNVTATFNTIAQCTVTVQSAGATGGGSIIGSSSQSASCDGSTVTFIVAVYGGYTATPSEGSLVQGTSVNWSLTVSANPTRTITITYSQGQTGCTSYVQLSLTNAGGSVSGANPASATCGAAVSFSGIFNSGYSGGSATEGTFSPSGLYWSLGGISAPTTNGQTKTVSLTFTGSGPTPGACTSGIDLSSDVARAIRLDKEIRSSSGGYIGKYGYENPGIYTNTSFYLLPASDTVVFLVDPAGFGLEPAATPSNIGISVMDYSQTAYGQLTLQVKRADRSNCYIKNVGMMSFNNQFANFYDTRYSAGDKFLIYVTAPASMNVAIRWGF
jgi:uncharacterized repeat protein (TIGR02543 family)